MKKLISFSLWGNNPKYCIGAIKNAELAAEIYPDWACRFYVSNNVSKDIVNKLIDLNAQIFLKEEEPNWKSLFWRFEAGHDKNYDIVIFRDTDSRLNLREKFAVDEWENSDKTFHIMRDHPAHKLPILGGMWGMKINDKYDFKKILESFEPQNKYGTDYLFLQNILYDLIGDDKITHDEIFEKQLFPKKRIGYEFVGQVFDENDERNLEHENGLIQFLRQ